MRVSHPQNHNKKIALICAADALIALMGITQTLCEEGDSDVKTVLHR
jgi:hypothetical protein